MNVYELAPRFSRLFSGLDTAFGTGAGRWIKRPPRTEDFVDHLSGRGPGIGIAPLRPSDDVLFAAIDLDEADFEAAQDMQTFLPGMSWLERSRSGNAHVWVFFREPLEAWIAMSLLRRATVAAGKKHVEVFPKNYSFERVKLGNYINLPYHGDQRPILYPNGDPSAELQFGLEEFLRVAEADLNDPDAWRKTAMKLGLHAPQPRESNAEFGNQDRLHICADHVISGGAGVVGEGSRAVVFFNLAKALTNWSSCDHDDALGVLRSFNDEWVQPKVPDFEIRRILANAEDKQYTSTGCDDPVFAPFAHPNCSIAHPRR